MKAAKATDKQLDYLLSLINKSTGSNHKYFSQARHELGLSSRQADRVTKYEASSMIEEWKEKAEAVS